MLFNIPHNFKFADRLTLKQTAVRAALLALSFLAFSSLAKADVIYEENFSDGLSGYSSSGRVYTGSYGLRLRGGASSSATSQAISLAGYTNVTLRVTRTASGLDSGEAGSIAVSTNGSFQTIDSQRSPSGTFSWSVPSAATSISLRFALSASSYFESYEVSSIVIEGTSTGGCTDCCPPEGCEPPPPPPPPPPSGSTDPGTGPWRIASDVAAECKLDPALLRAAEREFGNAFLIVRYGKLCHEYYPSGRDSASSVWSTTKTLGAVTVGALMYESRSLTARGRKTGPLTEFQRVDHWLDSFSYNDDATIAHVLAMEAHNRSLDYGDKSFEYDTVGSTQINTLSDVVNTVVAQDTRRLGSNIGEFYETYIADRLGFENSTWGSSNRSKTFAYSWTTTARDMGRLGLLLLNGGVWNGERILDAQYVYNLGHAAFEDGSTKYGYLTWLSEDDDCAPAPVHKSYPHGISEAQSCERRTRGCDQTKDVGVFYAAGLGGQYIIQHRGLDMVIVVKDSGGQSSGEVIRAWDAIRPAVVALDPNYRGNETAFCRVYGDNDYAPDLKLWSGGL